MHKLIRVLATAIAFCAAPFGYAATLNFDTPSVITIDNTSNQALYQEAGFNLTGNAAAFLTIDGIGSGRTGGLALFAGNTVSLTVSNGGRFSFLGLDAGLLAPASMGALTITGIFDDNSQRATVLTLSALGPLPLTAWTGLSGLRFSGNSDLVLDNVMVSVSPVPEPDSVAMFLLGIASLVIIRRVRHEKSRY